jgi:uncharacterized membrane protein YhhN
MKRLLIGLLVLIFILDLSIIGFSLDNSWRFYTKPLLVPILILYYCIHNQKLNWLFIGGLVMSFFGDLFLMFKGGFIAGLSSFLITHVLYIITFKAYFQKKNLYTIPLIGLFVIGLYGFLYPQLAAMKIPVLAYAVTIGTMLYVALGTTDKLLLLGATLFVISDSILAINLFYKHSTIGSLTVMFTYVLAQYALVLGMQNIDN